MEKGPVLVPSEILPLIMPRSKKAIHEERSHSDTHRQNDNRGTLLRMALTIEQMSITYAMIRLENLTKKVFIDIHFTIIRNRKTLKREHLPNDRIWHPTSFIRHNHVFHVWPYWGLRRPRGSCLIRSFYRYVYLTRSPRVYSSPSRIRMVSSL